MKYTIGKLLYAVFLMLFALPPMVHSQYDKVNTKINLRGKAAVAFLEDWWLTTATLGVEYHFVPKHSIGLDGFIWQTKDEDDFYNEETKEENLSGPDQKRRKYTLLFDYRYYFLQGNSKNNVFDF